MLNPLTPPWLQMGAGNSVFGLVAQPEFVDSQSTRWVHPYRTGLETKSNFVAPFTWTTE